MAVSAYASLVSLTHVLDNVHYRTHHRRLRVDIVRIETLQEKVNLLLDFVGAHSLRQGQDIRRLWRQIAEFAFDADQTFDSHVVDQLLCQSQRDLPISAFHKDVERLIQKTKELLSDVEVEAEAEAEGDEAEDALADKQPAVSQVLSGLASGGKPTLVGFDEHVLSIMDKLTSYESKLQIIPLVGMGGIGAVNLPLNQQSNYGRNKKATEMRAFNFISPTTIKKNINLVFFSPCILALLSLLTWCNMEGSF